LENSIETHVLLRFAASRKLSLLRLRVAKFKSQKKYDHEFSKIGPEEYSAHAVCLLGTPTIRAENFSLVLEIFDFEAKRGVPVHH